MNKHNMHEWCDQHNYFEEASDAVYLSTDSSNGHPKLHLKSARLAAKVTAAHSNFISSDNFARQVNLFKKTCVVT